MQVHVMVCYDSIILPSCVVIPVSITVTVSGVPRFHDNRVPFTRVSVV